MRVARLGPLVLLVSLMLALAVLPSRAAAAVMTARPEPGPLNPAFVEAVHDPLVALGLGRLPSPVEVHVGAAAETKAARMALPSSYSLIDEGRVTAVQDQGEFSTCWAFANISALESKLLPGESWDFSEDNLVRRSGYFPTMDERYAMGGWDFMAVAYFARWAGPVTEADDPYDHLPGTSTTVKHVQDVVMIPGRRGANDNDLIKQLVMANGALSVGMYWSPDAYSESADTYYLGYPWGENHGVDIVGWDDARPAADFRGSSGTAPAPPGPGAFLVRNSWGSGWGEAGYFWVSYYDRSFAREQGLGTYGGATSYADVEPTDNYSNVYQYDKLGVTDHWGYDSTRVWGANKFTAASTQTIAAASFYALSSSTRYQVWAGRSFRSLTLRASGTADLPGYITVPLDTPLRVYGDRSFVIAVKLVSPDETHPLAIERPAGSWMSGATAGRGQSYISRNGSTWTDTTTVRPRSNVCIKAFGR